MIFSEIFLFYKKIEIFESIFNYFDYETFIVCYHHSARDVSIDIVEFELSKFRVAKKEMIKMKITSKIEKNLVNLFAVENTFTKSKKSIIFNIETTFPALNSHYLVILNE